jgi:hypothetical protein
MSTINAACQVIRTLVGASRVVESVEKTYKSNDAEFSFCALQMTAETVSFFCNTMCVIGEASDFTFKSLMHLKDLELSAQALKTSIIFAEAVMNCSQGHMHPITALEKGLIAPTAGILRVIAEHMTYQYHYLATLPDNERYVFQVDSCDANNLTYKKIPISLEECESKIKAAEQALPVINITEIATQSGIISASLLRGSDLYQNLVNEVITQPPLVPIPLSDQNLMSEDLPSVFDSLPQNATELRKIPESLSADPVFSRFVCPITLEPIRDPVLDPNGTTLYERNAILEVLRHRPFSPMTRRPLQPHQLRDAANLKMLIDHRLSNYLRLVRNAIDQGMIEFPSTSLLQSVNQEHPNY